MDVPKLELASGYNTLGEEVILLDNFVRLLKHNII